MAMYRAPENLRQVPKQVARLQTVASLSLRGKEAEIYTTGQGAVCSLMWRRVVGPRKIKFACFCEFGMAEEVIGFLAFTDGTFEVGIGECARPYIRRYAGKSLSDAWWSFEEQVIKRCWLI